MATAIDIDDPPLYLRCPITHELLDDPVVLVGSSITYSRRAIHHWLRQSESNRFVARRRSVRCPVTNKQLTVSERILLPNFIAREAVSAWVDKTLVSGTSQIRDHHCQMPM